MSKEVEDKENHITVQWGVNGTGYYSRQEDMYFDFFKEIVEFSGGNVLEIGPGTGKFARLLINEYPIKKYTVLDLAKNITDSIRQFSTIGFTNGVFVESKNYKNIFNKKYDLFIACNCLSEVPDYYREDIINNVFPNCEQVFIIDGDIHQKGFNEWLESSVRNNFQNVIIEETRQSKGRAYSGNKGNKMGRVNKVPESKPPIRLEPGCQPYIHDQDTIDPVLQLASLDNYISKISSHLGGKVLDVGCGNGRLNMIHDKYFSKITGIDKFRKPNPKYESDKFDFLIGDIFSYNEKVDVVFFMGTFYLHYHYGYKETLKKAKELGHTIVIIDNALRNTSADNDPGHYDLPRLAEELGMSIVQKEMQENGPLGLYVVK